MLFNELILYVYKQGLQQTRKNRQTIFLDQIYGSGKTRFGVEFLGPVGVKRVRNDIIGALQDNVQDYLSKIPQTKNEDDNNKETVLLIEYCTNLLDDIVEHTKVVHFAAPLPGTSIQVGIKTSILSRLGIPYIDDMHNIMKCGPDYFVKKMAQVGKHFFIVIDELSPKIEEVLELWTLL